MTRPRSAALSRPEVAPRRWPGHALTGAANSLVAELLAELPHRRAHSELAGRRAEQLAAAVPPPDRDLFVAAAYVHDIGYAAELRQTGFHPVDGARYLVATGAPRRLAALVAHHSESRFVARALGLLPELNEFERENSALTDALSYADMTAGPTGEPMTVEERLRDIARRHRGDDPAVFAARLARVPWLFAAVDRVRGRLAS